MAGLGVYILIMRKVGTCAAVALGISFALAAGCKKPESRDTAANGQAAAATNEPLEKRVAALMQPLIDDGWAEGLMVGVVQSGKESLFAFGSLGDQTTTAIDENTVFEIGSVTKVFTAVLLADMATKGEVSLDEPVAKSLPSEWRVPTPGGKPIALKNLAAHISGLPNVPANFWKKGDNIYDADLGGQRWGGFSEEQFVDYFANPAPPPGPPGKYIYSNLGVGLLGHTRSLSDFFRGIFGTSSRPRVSTSGIASESGGSYAAQGACPASLQP